MPDPVFVTAQDVKDCAVEVIRENPTLFSHIEPNRILFLSRDTGAANKVAYIRGITGEVALATEYVYIIVVVRPNYNLLSIEDQKKVILHELLHIDRSFGGKLIKHDVQDFRLMLEKYGIRYLPETLVAATD